MRTSAIALVVVTLAALPALANDTSAELSTGGLIFVRNDDVEMPSEVSPFRRGKSASVTAF